MKLLYISYGGLAESEKAYFREYARQGVDLTVIVPSRIPVNKVYSPSGYLIYSHKDDEEGYRFLPVDLIKPNYIDSFNFFQLYRAVKKSGPDIIHIYNEYSSLHLAQTVICRNILYDKKKVPIVAYVLQNIAFKDRPLLFNFSLYGLKGAINKALVQPLIFNYHKKNIGGVIGVNLESLENIRALGVNVPMECIFTGINPGNFYPKDRDSCRAKVGIPKDVKLVGYFGRIVKEKGLDKLVEAVSRIDNCYLMLVGSGYEWDDYEAKLDKVINSFKMRGRIFRFDSVGKDKLLDYYNCLDVFVLPSQTTSYWKEQYALVLTEAMFCHLPVIGSSTSAVPERLEGYPRHLIFQEDSVDDLVDKIKKIGDLEFPKDFDINKFLYKHSAEHFAAAHIKFYKKLLSKNE